MYLDLFINLLNNLKIKKSFNVNNIVGSLTISNYVWLLQTSKPNISLLCSVRNDTVLLWSIFSWVSASKLVRTSQRSLHILVHRKTRVHVLDIPFCCVRSCFRRHCYYFHHKQKGHYWTNGKAEMVCPDHFVGGF